MAARTFTRHFVTTAVERRAAIGRSRLRADRRLHGSALVARDGSIDWAVTGGLSGEQEKDQSRREFAK
jgi:hypothetical protein